MPHDSSVLSATAKVLYGNHLIATDRPNDVTRICSSNAMTDRADEGLGKGHTGFGKPLKLGASP